MRTHPAGAAEDQDHRLGGRRLVRGGVNVCQWGQPRHVSPPPGSRPAHTTWGSEHLSDVGRTWGASLSCAPGKRSAAVSVDTPDSAAAEGRVEARPSSRRSLVSVPERRLGVEAFQARACQRPPRGDTSCSLARGGNTRRARHGSSLSGTMRGRAPCCTPSAAAACSGERGKGRDTATATVTSTALTAAQAREHRDTARPKQCSRRRQPALEARRSGHVMPRPGQVARRDKVPLARTLALLCVALLLSQVCPGTMSIAVCALSAGPCVRSGAGPALQAQQHRAPAAAACRPRLRSCVSRGAVSSPAATELNIGAWPPPPSPVWRGR